MSETGKVLVVDPTDGSSREVDAAEAQAGFTGGKVQLPTAGESHLTSADGKATMIFPNANVDGMLAKGWRFADKSEVLRRDAKDQGLRAFVEGAASELTLGASDLAAREMGAEGLQERRETGMGRLGQATGFGVGMAGPALLEKAVGQGVKGLTLRAAEGALAPMRAVTAAGDAIEHAATQALSSSIRNQAVARALGSFAGRGAEGAVFGAGAALSEEALGNPDMNAQSLVGAIGAGALVGAGVGGVAGAGLRALGDKMSGRIGWNKNPGKVLAESTGTLPKRTYTAEEFQAALEAANGNAFSEDASKGVKGWLYKAYRKASNAALGGGVSADIDAVNSRFAQEVLRKGDTALEERGRELVDVVDKMVDVQNQSDKAAATMRQGAMRELFPKGAAGSTVAKAGDVFDQLRAGLDGIERDSAHMGLGESPATVRKARAAVDAAEQRLMDRAGVPSKYTERIEREVPVPVPEGEAVAGAASRAPLSADDQKLIDEWTEGDYRRIRSAMDDGKDVAAYGKSKRLEQLIAERGEQTGPVFRGVAMEDKELNELLRHGQLDDPRLSSWAPDRETAEDFAHYSASNPHTGTPNGKTKVVFSLDNGHGLKLAHSDPDMAVPEVLTHGGQYKIVGAEMHPDHVEVKLHGPPPPPEPPPPTPKTTKVVEEVERRRGLGDVGNGAFNIRDSYVHDVHGELLHLQGVLKKAVRPGTELGDRFQQLWSPLSDHLSDESIYGKAAALQRDVEQAEKAQAQAFEELKKHVRIVDGKVDPASVRDFVSRLDRTGDAGVQAFDAWHAASLSRAEIMDKYFTGNTVASQARALGKQYGAARKSLDSTVEVLGAAKRLSSRSAQARESGVLTGALLNGASHSLGLGMMGPVLGEAILNPGRAALIRANLGAMLQRVGEHMDGRIENLMTGAKKLVPSMPTSTRMIAKDTLDILAAQSPAARREAYEKRIAEISRLQDPQAFGDHMAQQTLGLSDHVPKHVDAMTNLAVRSLGVLQASMPQARPGTVGDGGPFDAMYAKPVPHDRDILKFAQVDHALQAPVDTLLDAIEKGHVPDHVVAAIQQAYPDLLNKVRSSILEHASNAEKPPSHRMTTVLNKVLGGPEYGSRIAQFQSVHTHAQQAGPPGAPKVKTPRSQALLTSTDRLDSYPHP